MAATDKFGMVAAQAFAKQGVLMISLDRARGKCLHVSILFYFILFCVVPLLV
jgi:hypothetical protein